MSAVNALGYAGGMTECAVDSCSNPHLAKGYCNVHYLRWKRHGDPLREAPGRGGYRIPLADRFASKVSPLPEDDGCQEWLGATARGYGVIGSGGHDGRNLLAHRLALTLSGVEVPDHLFVLHRCDNPRCVRVSHLFVGTNTDNMRDMVAKGRGRQPSGLPPETWVCTRDDCDRRGIAKGLCQKHYDQARGWTRVGG